MNEELERYLAEVANQLSVDPVTEREILREIRTHLEEAVAELREEGLGSYRHGIRGKSSPIVPCL